ncbi:MAG: cyclic pyranopterin monophosphate synthase MoaC [Firmicutes bacterium]|nr:cyclic pyranopterin monophosphate synthase MoaC [Bacillota bacterium]
MDSLNHFGNKGNAVMTDISQKEITERVAVAEGFIKMNSAAFSAIQNGTAKKGDVLATARIGGIMAAKRTFELIPLCHNISLTSCKIDFSLSEEKQFVKSLCTVKCTGKTGAEMEALTGVSVSLLTIYDMLKAVDRAMEIYGIALVEKNGGKSGHYMKKGEEND